MIYKTPEWMYQSIKGVFKFMMRMTYDVKTYGVDNLDEIDNNKGFILAANHGSIVDALVMGLEIDSHRVRFLGRQRTLWGNPVFGKLNDILGTIPVPERLDKEKSSVIEVTVKSLKDRACVGIFPEGAILQRRKKFEGKTGTARIALEAGVPIVPVGLLGTDGLWPYGAKMPRLGRKVKMYVGEPVYFDDYHGLQDNFEVVRYVRDLSMQSIRKVSGWYNVPKKDIVELYNYYNKLPKPTI